MDFKYKISDVAKDFGISTKKVIDMVAQITGETRKTGGTVDEQELNHLLEKLVSGRWDEQFVILEPGETFYNDQFIKQPQETDCLAM